MTRTLPNEQDKMWYMFSMAPGGLQTPPPPPPRPGHGPVYNCIEAMLGVTL